MPSSLKLRGSNGRKCRILLQWKSYQLVKRDAVIGGKRIEYDRVVWNGLVVSERRTAYVVLRRLPYNAAAFIVKHYTITIYSPLGPTGLNPPYE